MGSNTLDATTRAAETMIDPATYRESIVGISKEIHKRQQYLSHMRQYLSGDRRIYKSTTCYAVGLSFYSRGLRYLREIERLEEIKAGMQMQLEVYYHLNKNKAA